AGTKPERRGWKRGFFCFCQSLPFSHRRRGLFHTIPGAPFECQKSRCTTAKTLLRAFACSAAPWRACRCRRALCRENLGHFLPPPLHLSATSLLALTWLCCFSSFAVLSFLPRPRPSARPAS
ncbi:unnamed protein product, partial [Phaeothamnion confervicola]